MCAWMCEYMRRISTVRSVFFYLSLFHSRIEIVKFGVFILWHRDVSTVLFCFFFCFLRNRILFVAEILRLSAYLHSNYVFRWMDFPKHFFFARNLLILFRSQSGSSNRLDCNFTLEFYFMNHLNAEMCCVHIPHINKPWNGGKIKMNSKIGITTKGKYENKTATNKFKCSFCYSSRRVKCSCDI